MTSARGHFKRAGDQAARVLGWTQIAAVVRDETDDQAYILALVENLQREDLSPREEAAALEGIGTRARLDNAPGSREQRRFLRP
jgi:hypothetical protein